MNVIVGADIINTNYGYKIRNRFQIPLDDTVTYRWKNTKKGGNYFQAKLSTKL